MGTNKEAISNQLGYIHRWEPGTSDITVVLLHGTGGDEHDLISLGRAIAPDANLLSPRGNVLEAGRYNRFFKRMAEGVFDQEDLALRSGELAEFVTAASAKYGFDPAKVWTLGFSNGANIAAAVLVLHPSIFSGAILLSPQKPIESNKTPDLKSKHVFIGAGELDGIAPRDGVESLRFQLANFGADVETRFYPIGHGIETHEIADAKAWFQSHLK